MRLGISSVWAGVGILTLLIFGHPVQAQTTQPLRPWETNQPPTPDFKARIDRCAGQLAEVVPLYRAYLDQLESTKVISEQGPGSDEMYRKWEAYVECIKGATDVAFRLAELFAHSQGHAGSIGNMQALEDSARTQAATLIDSQKRAAGILDQLRNGGILLDKPLLDQLNPGQRNEFREYLTPPARQKYNLDKQGYLNFHRFAARPALDASGRSDKADQFTALFTGWLISPAEAAYAAGCLATCTTALATGAWGPCIGCLRTAWDSIQVHWVGFQRCWAGTDRPPWLPLEIWRAGCVATFLAIVA